MTFRRTQGDIIRDGGSCSLVDSRRSATADQESHYYPELPPSTQATISHSAQKTILAEIRAGMAGMEVGGWLLSNRAAPDRIVLATGPGDSIVTRASISISVEPLHE